MNINIFPKTKKLIQEGDIINKEDIAYYVRITSEYNKTNDSEPDKIFRESFDSYEDAIQWISTTLLVLKPELTGTCTSLLHKQFTIK